jgi:hypothetical protein
MAVTALCKGQQTLVKLRLNEPLLLLPILNRCLLLYKGMTSQVTIRQ